MTTNAPDEAATWVARTEHPSFDEWEAFEAWLAADPDNAKRYDDTLDAIGRAAVIAATLPVATTPVVEEEAPPRRRAPLRWAGGAIAAALVGAVGLSVWADRAQPYAIATMPGEQRTVALADGSSIVLAGGTRVMLDHAQPRTATLDGGAALFRVRHDASKPFVVQAGAMKMVDLGTVFDVRRDAGTISVAVGEGAVMVDPDGAAMRLAPGDAARFEGGRLARQEVIAADVGKWRIGLLSFDDASLAQVAATLTRTLAHEVTAAPAIATQRFQGTLETRQIEDDPVLLGRLLGVRVVQQGAAWRLEPLR